jgi:hypothetical protein
MGAADERREGDVACVAVADTVLVRTLEPDVFLAGTVEGLGPGYVDVSYPDLKDAPRAAPERVSLDRVCDPRRIDAGPQTPSDAPWFLPASGRRLAVLDRQRARLVELERDVDLREDVDEEVDVRACTLSADGGVLMLPRKVTVRAKTLFAPAYFSEMRRLQFLAPVDPLIDVYMTPVLLEWTWSGRARALIDGTSVEADVVMTLRNRRIDAEMRAWSANVPLSVRRAMPTSALLLPCGPGVFSEGPLMTWEAHRVHFYGTSEQFSTRSPEQPDLLLRFRIPDLTLRSRTRRRRSRAKSSPVRRSRAGSRRSRVACRLPFPPRCVERITFAHSSSNDGRRSTRHGPCRRPTFRSLGSYTQGSRTWMSSARHS